jgi:hypothetical protein
MVCAPTASVEVLNVATPVAEIVAVPITVPPVPPRKVTVPEKIPPKPTVPLCATVAVNCSVAPATAGFALAAIVVAVETCSTVSLTAAEVEVRSFPSPL